MVLKRLAILGWIFLLNGCDTSESTEQLQASTEKMSGQQLFVQHCAMCHGEDGRLGSGGAADLTTTSMDEKSIRSVLVNGKNAMPAMKDKLGDGMEKVIAYTKELSKK